MGKSQDEESWDGISDDEDEQQSIDLTETLANIKPSKTSRIELGEERSDGEQDEDEDEDDFIRLSSKKANFKAGSKVLKSSASNKKISGAITGGGSFQSLGLHPSLLRAILLRGFNTPTPIQRAVLPHILASPPRDVVGMARTGSGKTLAYLIPLIQSLGGIHSIQFGIRALILVPTRELALQVLKVGKDLAKGFIQGDRSKSNSDDPDQARKVEGLRWGLIVGGDSLEDQFTMFSTNPDVIIATPGRLLHLVVEMNLDLKSVSYVVFDEADRLFEMGFATQLEETLHRLPANRQTLLFSATLPKTLVEFAKAGLQNPKLIRLDSESKISSDLQMAFLSVKPIEKEAALLVLISNVVGVPKADMTDTPNDDFNFQSKPNFSRGTGANSSTVRTKPKPTQELAAHQTIVFVATKHHVEYLGGLLTAAGYRVSLIYGALDQIARREQLQAFRLGQTNIMVVTDLAARGIDIPILENVINFDFPSSARAFVHRVGRTARAGRKGWAYSLVTQSELPFLMDLQLFLSRPLLTCPLPVNADSSQTDFTSSLVIGTIPRELLDAETEYVRETLVSPNSALIALGTVVKRAQKMYEKSQSTASNESYRRSKEFVLNGKGFSGTKNEEASIHLIFQNRKQESGGKQVRRSVKRTKKDEETVHLRDQLLAKVNQFTPNETVFEIGTRGKGVAAQLMRDRRKSMGKKIVRTKEAAQLREEKYQAEQSIDAPEPSAKASLPTKKVALVAATEGELEETFEMPRKKTKVKEGFRDPEAYLTYEQSGAAAEKGYNLNEGTSAEFVSQSKLALFDLGTNDEGKLSSLSSTQKASQVKWDRKTKKFVKVNQLGQDNIKLVKTESGMKLPATFKTGTFDNWKKTSKIKIPNVGEHELLNTNVFNHLHRKFRHQSGAENGPRNNQDHHQHRNGGGGGDHHHQSRGKNGNGVAGHGKGGKKVFTKTIDGQKKFLGPSHVVTRGSSTSNKSHFSSNNNTNKHSSKSNFSGHNRNQLKHNSKDRNAGAGLKSVDQIRKSRDLKERRKIRSNQPSRRKK
ncbi:hypothetical protein PSTG_16326 [Puccinia striiformis f. sp. tritici PST-78]|uniref:RNA helicase n=1 Tax=Puccinia striiformis f. sp. tritici PST-78 TaxID=1165861 RepID=A0A0L0UTY0_9BASI|nr:hypothetical protein PSTG_16326 [Puccinia striiformis f. sp. tritici PST-78]